MIYSMKKYKKPRNAYAFLGSVLSMGQQGISHSAECDHGLCPLDSRQGLCPVEPASFKKLDQTFYTYLLPAVSHFVSFSIAAFTRFTLSSLPSTAHSSTPPPGVIALPESATLRGHSIQPFLTPCFSISAKSAV